MPRDIPVGNGRMLVCFDQRYQLRDLYYPHVGQENHVGGAVWRFGVYGDLVEHGPRDRRRRRLAWTSDGWDVQQGYQPDTLATDVRLNHPEMAVRLHCRDAVDFHRDLLVRRIEVHNDHDEERTVSIYANSDVRMFGNKVGDTAYFDPRLHAVVHYREQRYVMVGFYADGEPRLDGYATGNSGYGGAEGTWRDAEDGKLGGNAIAQGAVDSTIGIELELPAASAQREPAVVYLIVGCGRSYADLAELRRFLDRVGPDGSMQRTEAYWRLWSWGNNWKFGEMPEHLVELFRRSLLILRTHIDNNGSIIAANDSDIMQFQRDTYSYMWPRDGALVAHALDLAGYPEVTRRFYYRCAQLLSDDGYLLHKYNPDGSPASSWHPWVVAGRSQLPIQEDETALVVWALWRHYFRYRDIEFVRGLWVTLIQPAADFMARYRDPASGLPLPSYDLWEERWGVHAFTVASVYGGLMGARNFALCFDDRKRAELYDRAASEVKAAFESHFWDEARGRFLRRIEPTDTDRVGALIALLESGGDPSAEATDLGPDDVEYYRDATIDASLFGIYKFGLAEADDPRVEATMRAVGERLWVKTPVGGVARYEDDPYHRVSDDVRNVPGNPWLICTLWLADWRIARATTEAELSEAMPALEWVARRALRSGVLAEQVHPLTGAPMSVSPLTWSHATYVDCVMGYLERAGSLGLGESADGAPFPTAGHGRTHVADRLLIDRQRVEPLDNGARDRGGSGDVEGIGPP